MRGSKLTVLGSGNAFNEDGRGFAGLLVEPARMTAFLVDIGPSTMIALDEVERATVQSIDRLFLTHLHGDHVAGWPFWLLHARFVHQRQRPFDVFGPPGTRRVLEGLVELCYAELFEVPSFPVRIHEWPVEDGTTHQVDEGLSVDVLPMDHHPSSIGLRFRVGDHVLGVSGDTRWCDNLCRLAEGCNLLVMECSHVERRPSTAHVSLDELRERLDELSARRIALVHLNDEVARRLGADPLPRVTATHDGTTLEL